MMLATDSFSAYSLFSYEQTKPTFFHLVLYFFSQTVTTNIEKSLIAVLKKQAFTPMNVLNYFAEVEHQHI